MVHAFRNIISPGGFTPANSSRIRRASFLILLVLLAACTTVEQTEHCLLTRYGNVIEDKMDPGIHWTPFTQARCFTLTDQNFPRDAAEKETMEAQTKDPMTVTGDVAIVYSFDPTNIKAVYLEKRSEEAAEVQILNAIRDGYRSALAGWTVNDIFSAQRSFLGDSVRIHIQRKLGALATVKQVYIRDIKVPPAIESARVAATQQALILDKAQKQLAIDSMNARGQIIVAEATSRAKQLEAQSYTSNPKLLDVQIAEAMANLCKGVTTCIIGASPNALLGLSGFKP